MFWMFLGHILSTALQDLSGFLQVGNLNQFKTSPNKVQNTSFEELFSDKTKSLKISLQKELSKINLSDYSY